MSEMREKLKLTWLGGEAEGLTAIAVLFADRCIKALLIGWLAMHGFTQWVPVFTMR